MHFLLKIEKVALSDKDFSIKNQTHKTRQTQKKPPPPPTPFKTPKKAPKKPKTEPQIQINLSTPVPPAATQDAAIKPPAAGENSSPESALFSDADDGAFDASNFRVVSRFKPLLFRPADGAAVVVERDWEAARSGLRGTEGRRKYSRAV